MKILNKLLKNKKKDVLQYPWQKYYDEDIRNVEVEDISIYDFFEKKSYEHINNTAINYFGEKLTFKELLAQIDLCAKALKCYGVRENDVVSIMLPNTPEAVIAFYAVSKIGAIANMIHPLSSEVELKNTLIATNQFY